MTGSVELGRRSFAAGAWAEAFARLRDEPALAQDDVERLAVAAHLVGQVQASELAWERAQRLAARAGDPNRAALCAFWLGFDLLLRGESARASGWLARSERLASDAPGGTAEGFLLLPPFLAALGAGDTATALELAGRMLRLARAAPDTDLLAFALLCEGEALIVRGDVDDGMRRLDEAMIWITGGDVSPIATGIIYCAVIGSCMHACDVRRAAEWTEALSAWCSTDPSLVPYRGQCLVHRSQVLTAKGAWRRASEEAERARAHLADPPHPALGDALYQQAELHRLLGELAEAEEAYRAASRRGREPIPGFGLLRLAQGRVEAATGSARRMLGETSAHPDRPAILAAVIEILVAAGVPDEAVRASDELDGRARTTGNDVLTAMASAARGSLLVARGDMAGAAGSLREAIGRWRRLDMPYDEARARVTLADVYRALGDDDAADLERDAAVATFEELGAAIDLARIRAPRPATPLTDRECEVLRLVAAGRTNREIAAELLISEHTVARHLQNIFVKLGRTSRAAATAYAFEHGIV